MDTKTLLEQGKGILGIEFGSTRIKAVLVNDSGEVLAGGSHGWENRLDNGIWTYTLDDIWGGLQSAYADLKKDVNDKYGVGLTGFRAMGFSAMMHGYLAFDAEGALLVPFRTWRNTITGEASKELTEVLNYTGSLRDVRFWEWVMLQVCSPLRLRQAIMIWAW